MTMYYEFFSRWFKYQVYFWLLEHPKPLSLTRVRRLDTLVYKYKLSRRMHGFYRRRVQKLRSFLIRNGFEEDEVKRFPDRVERAKLTYLPEENLDEPLYLVKQSLKKMANVDSGRAAA